MGRNHEENMYPFIIPLVNCHDKRNGEIRLQSHDSEALCNDAMREGGDAVPTSAPFNGKANSQLEHICAFHRRKWRGRRERMKNT